MANIGTHTNVIRCSVVELVAIDRAARGRRQRELLLGLVPWARRDYALLERLRDVRGVTVIEAHGTERMHVTVYGNVRTDGFTKKI